MAVEDDPLRTPGSPAPQPAPEAPLTGDWPAQAADAIVDLVGTVRDRTLGPVYLVARALVYGIVVAVLGLTALVLLVIALVRFLDWAIPGEVWSAYLALGSVSTLLGMALWSRRRPVTES